MLVLDETRALRHCEPWVTGALYIGGLGVAAGYFRDEVRTAKQFVKCPHTGKLMFRTGDLARVRSGATGPQLEFLGREDAQVKLNGFRIELGEVEQALMDAHPAVHTAVCAVFDNKLVGYIVSSQAPPPNTAELIAHCETTLPSFAVPRYINFLSSLPLSANGKVQRSKLPLPTMQLSPAQIVTASTPTEQNLSSLVSRVLKRPQDADPPCAASSFFELGGDSQTALRLLAAIRSEFNVSLSVQAFFDSSSIVALAARVDNDTSKQSPCQSLKQQQLVRLDASEVDTAAAPLVLVCAAGASSLVYRRLSLLCSNKRGGVYAVEDRSLLHPYVRFEFESIQEAAQSVVDLVTAELSHSRASGIRLGGWSYGGVVAFEAAKLLTDLGVRVLGLLLLDAPIVPEVPDPVTEIPTVLTTTIEQEHFINCVKLLRKYYTRKLTTILPGVSIRAFMSSDGSKVDQSFSFSKLTSGTCYTSIVKDSTHWNIVDLVSNPLEFIEN